MSLSIVRSRAGRGLEAVAVGVEIHIAPGMPSLDIVGLPEKAVRESKYRVRAVISHSRFEFPCRRITVNLTPADLPKEGGRFDLPIALGILAASQQLPADALAGYEFLAELGLDGTLRPVHGVLPATIAAYRNGHALVLAPGNAAEASLVSEARVYSGADFLEVCEHFSEGRKLHRVEPIEVRSDAVLQGPDFAEVYGQHHAQRALEIAAAGRHHVLLMGAPGCGKTMLAMRFQGVLPTMTREESLQVAAVRSLCGEAVTVENLYQRPFRSPHHTASPVALAGGGSQLRPGEITRAHNGTLFLDEILEFGRRALEVLREPLEAKKITVARASGSVCYPADVQLIAAMNPCPDGSDVDERGTCRCSEAALRRYYARLSAPLLDRIDMLVRVPRMKWSDGGAAVRRCENSSKLKIRIAAASIVQMKRQGKPNAALVGFDLEKHCCLQDCEKKLLYRAADRLNLSARGVCRILRMSRTAADLEGVAMIGEHHLLEALSYRSMDKLMNPAHFAEGNTV